MKIEQKKILCGPSKMLKNISWPIDICLKYFMVPTKTLPPTEVIKEGSYVGNYFRDICSGINDKLCRKSWKEFQKLKTIGQKYYCSNYYDVSVNKYRVKCGIS